MLSLPASGSAYRQLVFFCFGPTGYALLLILLCVHLDWLESLAGTRRLQRWFWLTIGIALFRTIASTPSDSWIYKLFGRSSIVSLRYDFSAWAWAAACVLFSVLCFAMARLIRRIPALPVDTSITRGEV